MSVLRALLLSLLALVCGISASVLGQDDSGPTLEERREMVKKLAPEEKERLREALERFRKLPATEQDALRRKAADIGAERLKGLAGRSDVPTLLRKHELLENEIDRVFASIEPERLAGLSGLEREFLRSEALRGFQRFIRVRVLQRTGFRGGDETFERLRPEERRRVLSEGWAKIEEETLAGLPEAEAARIRSLPPRERRAERLNMERAYREAEALEFSKQFTTSRLSVFAAKSAEERSKMVEKWRARTRWFHAMRVLRDEVGVSEDSLRLMAPLPADAWGRVLFDVRQNESKPADERRRLVEESIRRVAGDRALDPELARRSPLMKFLRERRK